MDKFTDFIKNTTSSFTPVLNTEFDKNEYIPIDLSDVNTSLNTINIHSSQEFEDFVRLHIKKHQGQVAYGGYLEKRAIYNRSNHFYENIKEKERNIHIGMDLWCNAGTDVLAALDGTIHSYKDNDQIADYGPTIILEHKISNTSFYTLYGHLSRESLQNIVVGQNLKKGQVIAKLGNADVNGDYAPHLHFQIIKDLEGKEGDYPGVSDQLNYEFYKHNCPDPNLLLKIDTL